MRKKLFFPLLTFLLALFIILISQVLIKVFVNKSVNLSEKTNINILILGIGGADHDGPELTDTIMVANINIEKNLVNFVSIPRDLWIPDLNNKINTAYVIGEQKEKKGMILAKKVVERVISKPIDYTLVGDFSGFVKFIDLLGGIDVDIERSFDDYEYPIEEKKEDLCGNKEEEIEALLATVSANVVFPCRYQYVRFEKGLTHVDGKTALMFVRSRFSKSEEGTDFARSKRQQKVLSAVKEKTLSLGIILNPVKIFQIYRTIQDNILTDIKQEDLDDFIGLFQKMKDAKIRSFVLEQEDEKKQKAGLLINPVSSSEYSFQWVLVPRKGNGDFSEIYEYVNCVFTSEICSVKR